MSESKDSQTGSSRNESRLIGDLIAARRAGVPLIAIETADPASVIRQIKQYAEGKSPVIPLASWDKSAGFKPVNKAGEQALREGMGVDPDGDGCYPVEDPDKAFKAMSNMPRNTIVFYMNGQWYFNLAENVQAFWNLRDVLKRDKRIAILLVPAIKLPAELKHDIVVLEDPLPGTEELAATVKAVYKASAADPPEEAILTKAVEASRGLSLFEAEQVLAMSMEKVSDKDKPTLNLDRLWIKKKKSIEMSPSLRIYKGKETFADVKGIQVFKDFISKVMEGNDRPTVVLFWDELEKAFAGAQGDSSGVSQEMHGQILSWMADNDIPAVREMGHAGCSKSYVAKAIGGQFGVPVIIMNISEAKNKHVGQSTENLKEDLKVASAVGRPIVFATCNNEQALSPELRDRFNLGTWFFDIPSEEEIRVVFDVWMKKLNLKGDLPKDHKDWTPRNVHDCCLLAWRLKCSLEEASKFIVPLKRSNPLGIEELRRKAHGKYLSVTKEGTYVYSGQSKNGSLQEDTIRSIDLNNPIGQA